MHSDVISDYRCRFRCPHKGSQKRGCEAACGAEVSEIMCRGKLFPDTKTNGRKTRLMNVAWKRGTYIKCGARPSAFTRVRALERLCARAYKLLSIDWHCPAVSQCAAAAAAACRRICHGQRKGFYLNIALYLCMSARVEIMPRRRGRRIKCLPPPRRPSVECCYLTTVCRAKLTGRQSTCDG